MTNETPKITESELQALESLVAVNSPTSGFVLGTSKVDQLLQEIRRLQSYQDDLISEGYKMAASIGILAAKVTTLREKLKKHGDTNE